MELSLEIDPKLNYVKAVCGSLLERLPKIKYY